MNFTLDISPSCITTYPRKGAITITCYLQIFKCSYDPRKGARTLSPSGCNVSVLYDPRKGAEINVRPHDMPFHILSPQGDDNVSSLNSMILHCNLSPQGDDKTSFMPSLVPLMRIATYPRKGTITRLPLPSADFSDCNLSPQGDDNLMAAVICCRSSPLQLIPVRGR